jgi:hypothetical protein
MSRASSQVARPRSRRAHPIFSVGQEAIERLRASDAYLKDSHPPSPATYSTVTPAAEAQAAATALWTANEWRRDTRVPRSRK